MMMGHPSVQLKELGDLITLLYFPFRIFWKPNLDIQSQFILSLAMSCVKDSHTMGCMVSSSADYLLILTLL